MSKSSWPELVTKYSLTFFISCGHLESSSAS